MDAHPGESSAATADKPGTPAPGAFRGIMLIFLGLVQVGVAWLFAGHWLENLGPRLDGVATVPVWVSAATMALAVGAVAVEAVRFLRRRRDPVQVALTAMVLLQVAMLVESALVS
ncbi:hypothetical protein ACNHYB_12960 [Isoptericola jiangsuensis]|uniref:hypothetical protein n=1 Tax=Isoptericola jiangsuensis TaxID=548579 RepID=UPI003AAAFFA5